MSTGERHSLAMGQALGAELERLLAPHCQPGYCQIAGSIRRRKPTFGDIEIVCLPLPYQAEPLFRNGIASVVGPWDQIRGQLAWPSCRAYQCWIPKGLIKLAGEDSPRVKLDLYMPHPKSFGLIMAIRTGSAEWSHQVLARAWRRAGFESKDGVLVDFRGVPVVLSSNSEEAVFAAIGLPWVQPWEREAPHQAPLDPSAAPPDRAAH